MTPISTHTVEGNGKVILIEEYPAYAFFGDKYEDSHIDGNTFVVTYPDRKNDTEEYHTEIRSGFPTFEDAKDFAEYMLNPVQWSGKVEANV